MSEIDNGCVYLDDDRLTCQLDGKPCNRFVYCPAENEGDGFLCDGIECDI